MYKSNKIKNSLDLSEMPHISQLQASHLGHARPGPGGGEVEAGAGHPVSGVIREQTCLFLSGRGTRP